MRKPSHVSIELDILGNGCSEPSKTHILDSQGEKHNTILGKTTS